MDKTTNSIRLTLLGEVNEVGGNTVLLEDTGYDVKIFIDFGIKIKKYYNRYQHDHYPSSIEEIVQANLLHREEDIAINNLYATEINSKRIEESKPSDLDGILISHPHKDHYLGLSFVNRTIPIYTGLVTKRIIRAFCKSERSTIANNFKFLGRMKFFDNK